MQRVRRMDLHFGQNEKRSTNLDKEGVEKFTGANGFDCKSLGITKRLTDFQSGFLYAADLSQFGRRIVLFVRMEF